MRLVLFDIDGTLTDTMEIDAACFVRTYADVCGFGNIDTDWSRYRHATDSGIFYEIFETRMGRFPTAEEISQFRGHFMRLLAAASVECPFAATPGAARMLSLLADSGVYKVSLATGCWSDSARLKMASAGMCYDDYPSASCDDAVERDSIIKVSMEKAKSRFGGSVYLRRVCGRRRVGRARMPQGRYPVHRHWHRPARGEINCRGRSRGRLRFLRKRFIPEPYR